MNFPFTIREILYNKAMAVQPVFFHSGQYRIENDTFYDETSHVMIAEVFEDTPAKTAGLEKEDIV